MSETMPSTEATLIRIDTNLARHAGTPVRFPPQLEIPK